MSEGSWIDVDDELPEESVVVETLAPEDPSYLYKTTLKRVGNLWLFPNGSVYVMYTPTHWRPLSTSLHP